MTENSLEAIYQEHLKYLIKVCDIALAGETIDGIGAEDLVHRVFVRAIEKQDKLTGHENLLGWFVSACVKECKAVRTRRGRRQRILGRPVPLEENMTMEEQYDAILRWLNQVEASELLEELKCALSPLEERVYVHYYEQNKTARETADALNLKVNAVNDAARRIRSKAANLKVGTFIFLLCPIFEFLRRN